MRTAAFMLFVLLASFASAADADVQKRYVEDGKKQKATDEVALVEKIKNDEASEAAIKKAKPNPAYKGKNGSFSSGTDKTGKKTLTFDYYDPKDKEKALKNVQDRITANKDALEETKKAEYVTPKLNPQSLEVGQVGIVTVTGGNPVQYDVLQVIDKGNVIIKFGGSLHWLKTDTKGMVDGKRYALDMIVHVKGTKTYTATIGTKTVLELEEYKPTKK